MCVLSISRLNAKRAALSRAPLPRKTSCVTRVALQRCPALHMSKRKIILQGGDLDCQLFPGP
jgi:hypothetical protein